MDTKPKKFSKCKSLKLVETLHIYCIIVSSSGHFLASSREYRRKPVGKSENPTTSGLPTVSKQFKLPQDNLFGNTNYIHIKHSNLMIT